jgi:hypothetical protein
MFGRFQSSFFLICLTDLFFCEENIEKKRQKPCANSLQQKRTLCNSKEKKVPMRTNGTGVTLKKRNGSYRPVKKKKRTGVTVRSRLALGKLPRKASFVSTGSIPIGMDKYNKKVMIVTIRDPDLFRVEN